MKKRLFVWLLYIPLRRIQFSTYLLIMKKSTLKRLQAQTGTEATASNLNKVMGKRDARQVVNMDTEAEADYLAKWRKAAAAEFKIQFEAATWLDVDTKAARAEIKALSLNDIEAAKSATGSIDVRKLVSKAVGRATAAKRKAERKAQAEAGREATKQAKAEAKAIDRAAEQAEQAAACWFAA